MAPAGVHPFGACGAYRAGCARQVSPCPACSAGWLRPVTFVRVCDCMCICRSAVGCCGERGVSRWGACPRSVTIRSGHPGPGGVTGPRDQRARPGAELGGGARVRVLQARSGESTRSGACSHLHVLSQLDHPPLPLPVSLVRQRPLGRTVTGYAVPDGRDARFGVPPCRDGRTYASTARRNDLAIGSRCRFPALRCPVRTPGVQGHRPGGVRGAAGQLAGTTGARRSSSRPGISSRGADGR